MAAYCRVYDSCHLQADCQEPGSAPEPYTLPFLEALCFGVVCLSVRTCVARVRTYPGRGIHRPACRQLVVDVSHSFHANDDMHEVPSVLCAFSALTLLVGRQDGHPACKKTEWWGSGMVICLEQGADLHIAQLMPLLLTISCFSKIQIGFTFLVPAHLGSPGKRAVKRARARVCVCCVCVCDDMHKSFETAASRQK